MKIKVPEYIRIEGKTYTLFGLSDSTKEYYVTIRELAYRVSEKNTDTAELLAELQKFSTRKRLLKRAMINKGPGNPMDQILNLIDPVLRKYTANTGEHLKNVPITRRWDGTLSTSREQYHLYMLEIELNNRLNIKEFHRADRKIALMPYCLQDFTVACKSSKEGFDYQCHHCSAGCYQNLSSKILQANEIEPYIWQSGNMKQLAKATLKAHKRLSVIGIACIPELIHGIRDCRKNGIPVIGLPLNANRCIRWFGKFYPNSVDLEELHKLADPNQFFEGL